MYFGYYHGKLSGTATTSGNYTMEGTGSWLQFSAPNTWNNWPAPALQMPKWWRWFNVFRIWSEPVLPPLLKYAQCGILRIQERGPIGQRRKQKRRAYVQKLRAL